MTSRMKIAETQVGDVTILRVTGRLELEERDLVFRDYVNRLVAEGRVKIVLDLKDVTHIDSAGLGMLVSKYVSTRNHDGTIKLLNLTRRSNHLMGITGTRSSPSSEKAAWATFIARRRHGALSQMLRYPSKSRMSRTMPIMRACR